MENYDDLKLDLVELEDVEYFRRKLLKNQNSIKIMRQYELVRDAFIVRTLARIAAKSPT